jgi:tetratricopeptide (TPR) repeat protein
MAAMRAIVVACLLAYAGPAQAEEPWKVGVTEDQKKQAKVLLDGGNTLFVDKNYAEALAKYRAAIDVWDHPAIRFNVVRCLIQLERTDEAAQELKLALKYGAAPLEEAVYAEALAYEKLLAKAVAEIVINCPKEIKVTLDGQDVACGSSRQVKPGRRLVVGTREGYLTKTFEVIAVGGETQKVEVALVPLSKAAKIEHRWATWKPWVVFGAGLALVGIGGLVELQAQANMDAYKREVQRRCGDTPCLPGAIDDIAERQRDRAETQDVIAVSVMAIGAATAITGGVMLYLNRGRTVYEQPTTRVGVAPLVGGGALTVGGRF